MIKRINKSEEDIKKFSNLDCSQSPKQTLTNFSGLVVNKPWGYEYLMLQNENLAIWMLYIKPGSSTSVHCHPKKKTSLLLLSGEAICSTLNEKSTLKETDGIIFEKGVFHTTEAISEKGIFLLEIETPNDKYDLFRLTDKYHRPISKYSSRNNITNKTYNYNYLFIKGDVDSTNNFGKYRFRIREFQNCEGSGQSIENFEGNIGIVLNGEAETGDKKVCTGDIFQKNGKLKISPGTKILFIHERKNLIKVSDYVIRFLQEKGINHVFMISGGHIMHLLESVRTNKMNYLCNHHEQASVMAADGYARMAGKTGFSLVTNGPGATNTVTGVGCAWIDSIPLIVISGQANQTIGETGMRQFGIQELDIIKVVKPITKYAIAVTNPQKIRFHLEKAIYLASSGRPGPVWLEIPLYVQNSMIEESKLERFMPEKMSKDLKTLKDNVSTTISLLKESKRPMIIVGNGVRLAHAEKEFLELAEKLSIPIVTSRNGNDIIWDDHPLYTGRPGSFGQRAANLAIQNCDFLLGIGSRVAIAVTGWAYNDFARAAKKVIVDIDKAELEKPLLKPDLTINSDAKDFILELMNQTENLNFPHLYDEWKSKIKHWKEKYPVVLPSYKKTEGSINTYSFLDELSNLLKEDDVVITDMGMSFQCTMQTLRLKRGTRLLTASGLAPMGYGLPGAIGACIAHDKKRVICISGDGGLQMNVQELQTIVHNHLPIKIFVFNNKGYSSIRETQTTYFKEFTASDPSSGVSMPDFIKIAEAYGIKTKRISDQSNLNKEIREVLDYNEALLCDLNISEKQPVMPKQGVFHRPDGLIISRPIEDMIPYLDREDFEKEMIIEPVPFDPYKEEGKIEEKDYNVSNSSADSMS